MFKALLLLFCLASAYQCHAKAFNSKISLEPHAIEAGSLTVSGISAGGAMATQFHVAYSSSVKGVGMFAGIVYGCARDLLATALNCMSSPLLTTVSTLHTRTENHEKAGTIDPITNMANDKVYIFHGTSDSVVKHGNSDHIKTYYEKYLSSSANIFSEVSMDAEHCQPTDNFGTACSKLNKDTYINNCDYKGAYVMLNHLYGDLQVPGTSDSYNPENLQEFDQSEFFADHNPASSSMDKTGYVYIPTVCKDPTRLCRLHIAFHGCQQGAYKIGTDYVVHGGYLEVAEKNGIIVVFPQATTKVLANNPNGCFDWWGYDGKGYDTKESKQMNATMGMAKKLGY